MVVANDDFSKKILPRVLIVSRRTLRKNKFVDFVGEYHLDLIVSNGAVPVIVPRVTGIHSMLQSFEPIHGVLLCEGEDIDSSLYTHDEEIPGLSLEEMEEVKRLHEGDTTIDKEKDSIEMTLARLCLERNIPFLGICRGSQILNVAAGGTLHQDVDMEIGTTTKHIDYDNYDGHRHPISTLEDTPLRSWFEERDIMVNSYHHQGVKRLAERFVPMAYAPDGLIEGFYDPNRYNPEEGQFLMGLQFHPERMRLPGSDEFDYPGCASAYQEFVKAVIAFRTKQIITPKIELVMKKKKTFVKSFSIANFLEANTILSKRQENRLGQMGATVRNSSVYLKKMTMQDEHERAMEKFSTERLSELLSFHHMMARLCSEAIKRKNLEQMDRNVDVVEASSFVDY